MEEKIFLNTHELAKLLDINEKMVYALISEKGLPATKATGKWLFPKLLVEQWLLLGMGKGGPLVILRTALPGAVVDLGMALYPNCPYNLFAAILLGAVSSATRFFFFLLVDYLLGVDKTVLSQHAFFSSIMNILFAGLGAAMIPPVVRRLKQYQLIA